MKGDYCGCCGRPYPGSNDYWCDDCKKHVVPIERGVHRDAHTRTYFAQHHKACPFA